MSNFTMNATYSYKTIPYQECICSVIPIKKCMVDQLLRHGLVIPLILFLWLVHFFWYTVLQ